MTEAAPLFAVDYDPVGKGDDLVITAGRTGVDYSHTVSSPAEIWEAQDDNGEVAAVEIIDRNGAKTILRFTT